MEIADILEGIPLGVHIIDKNGITVFYNSACRKIDNIRPGVEVLGRPVTKLVEDGVLSKSIGLDVLESNLFKDEIQVVNGKQVYSQGTPLFDRNHQLRMVVVTCMDIPYLKKMETKLSELQAFSAKLMEQLSLIGTEDLLISSSPCMEKVKKLADKAARFDSNVLITGESGVGKGVVFTYIHNRSSRYNQPKISLNCAAIPEALFESELFGYEAGSFTGAQKNGKLGLLDLASEGTLFLDEIGDLSLANQAKLLKVMQEKKYMAVGGLKEKTSNVRIIAATNRDLKEMVRQEKFREDLFYRINVFPIHIPPLRERREDIVSLTRFLLRRKNEEYGMNKSLAGEVYRAFYSMPWPGNVRELENFIECLILTTDEDEIHLSDVKLLRSDRDIPSVSIRDLSYDEMMEEFEINLIKNLFEKHETVKEISQNYHINESTLRKKLKKYGFTLPELK